MLQTHRNTVTTPAELEAVIAAGVYRGGSKLLLVMFLWSCVAALVTAFCRAVATS